MLKTYLVIFFFVGCTSVIDVKFDQAVSPVSGLSLTQIPSSTTETPIISWEEEALETKNKVSHYEMQIVKASDNSVVHNWTKVENNTNLSGITNLDKFSQYKIHLRSVTSSGITGAIAVSPNWKPDSQECFGGYLSNTPFAQGDGSAEKPYLICTKEQLVNLSLKPEVFHLNFKIAAHIDMSGVSFSGIGSATNKFKAKFDGNNKVIKNMTIQKDSTRNIGFFNYTRFAHLSDLTLENFTVDTTLSSAVGALIGNCEDSQVLDISVSNINITGTNRVGGLIGKAHECSVYDTNLNGNVTNGAFYIGGVIGETEKSNFLNINSSIDVNSPNAEQVGGFMGAETWANVKLQNININSSINGKNDVGGFVGFQVDGLYIYRSEFQGSIEGQTNIGGISGANYDTSYVINSTRVFNTTITGEQNVGGFFGENGYRSSITDSYVEADLIGTGPNQQNFGGFYGFASYYADINNSYADVYINTNATRVGGMIGYINYWNASYDIQNSFTTSDIVGEDSSNSISLIIGQNDHLAVPGATLYYYSGASCTNQGTGSCNTDDGNPVATLTDFYDPNNAPLSSWDFTNTWQGNIGALPTLRNVQVSAPSASFSCNPTHYTGEEKYSCALTITDSDLNEDQFIKLLPNHTCHWLYASQRTNTLKGYPVETDIGTCTAAFQIIDGSLSSPAYSFDIDVLPAVFARLENYDFDNDYSIFDLKETPYLGGGKIFKMTLKNLENTPISSLSFSITGTTTVDFLGGSYPGTGGNCSTTLNAQEECDLYIQHLADDTNYDSGSFDISYTGTRGATSYSLNFSGTPVKPISVKIADESSEASKTDSSAYYIYFLEQEVSAGAKVKPIKLTNHQSSTITGMSATIAAGPYEFAGGSYPGTNGTCGTTLAAGETCLVYVSFDPSSLGSHNEDLNINYTAAEGVTMTTGRLRGEGI
ncbi:MAG: hypothetical protein QF441_03235 [Bacteriovoracaceae bacterium]|jgi:hypothetical protein|nr:hypothetical protein [Halobacteriovoraceae bacterium]MDP7319590.1 hypothetical protein [Bacteriovoracaceae bacterium]